MKIIVKKIAFLFIICTVISCSNDNLVPIYKEQSPGKIVIRGYNASTDSIQVNLGGNLLVINNKDAFTGSIEKDYEFVFYDDKPENIDIVNKSTGETLHSYSFERQTITDTISFYYQEDIWLDDVLSFRPGTLSSTGMSGYRFIFPTLNRYSQSGYDGPLDARVKKANGQLLGVAENITKEEFSSFVEFPFNAPPVFTIELVKHGTNESYIPGMQVNVQMVMQNNKSKLIILNEVPDGNGIFTGVQATVNLVDYFDY